MEEREEEGGSVATVKEPAVASTESALSESETLVASEACVVDTQTEGSVAADVAVEGAGASNGDDIMVEVLGSNVYVDGICTSDDSVEENSSNEGVSTQDGPEEDLKTGARSLEAEDVNGSSSKATEEPSEASLNLTSQNGFEKHLAVEEGFEKKGTDEEDTGGGGGGGGGEVIENAPLQEVGVNDNESMNEERESRPKGSSPDTVREDIEDVNAEEVTVIKSEEVTVIKSEEVTVIKSEEVSADQSVEGTEKVNLNMVEATVLAGKEEVEFVKEGVVSDVPNSKEVTVAMRHEVLEQEVEMEDVGRNDATTAEDAVAAGEEGDLAKEDSEREVARVEEVTAVERKVDLEGEKVEEGVDRVIAEVEGDPVEIYKDGVEGDLVKEVSETEIASVDEVTDAVKKGGLERETDEEGMETSLAKVEEGSVAMDEDGVEGDMVQGGSERELASVEEVTEVVKNEHSEGETVKEGVESVITKVEDDTVEMDEDVGIEGELVMDGVDRDIASVDGQIQMISAEEVDATAGVDGVKKPFSDAQQESSLIDGDSVLVQEPKVENVGSLDEVSNLGNESAITSSGAAAEALNVEAPAIGEEEAAMVVEKNLTLDDDGRGNDSFSGLACSSESNQTSAANTVRGDTQHGLAISDDISTDSNILHKEVEATVGADAPPSMDGKDLPSLGLKLEECLDEGKTQELAQVDSNTEQPMEIDRQDNESQHLKAETVNNLIDGSVSTDSKNSDKSAQEDVRGDVEAVGSNVLLDPNFDISNYIDFSDLSCSGNGQHIKSEAVCAATEIDSQVTDRVEEVATMDTQGILAPNFRVEEPADRNEGLKLDECVDKGTAYEYAQVDPDKVEEMEIERHVTDTEQSVICGGNDVEGNEQLEKVQTIGSVNDNEGNVCEDPALGFQARVVDVGAVGKTNVGKVLDETSHSADLAGVLSFSGDDQNLIAERESVAPMYRDQEEKAGECSEKIAMDEFSEVDGNMQNDDHFFDPDHFCLHEEQETEAEELDIDFQHTEETSQGEIVEQATLELESPGEVHQASYQLPMEAEGNFSVSDLVWGKVRSHPWWPGQIFDPSDASEKAMKYHKKDCFLVAYFGDRTFAWNDASVLKPLNKHFSQIEKQSKSETFHNAVNCALEEVSRRVGFELACSCLSEDAYNEMRFQIIENSGIRQESSIKDSLLNAKSVSSFEPDKLIEYMKALAQSLSGGANSLDLVIAKAQLQAFYRLKGYYQLPEFQFCGTSLEEGNTSTYDDGMHLDEHANPAYTDNEPMSSGQETLGTQKSSYNRRKHNLKGGLYHRKRGRDISDMMDDSLEYPNEKLNNNLVSASSIKKRRVVDSLGDDSLHEGRKTISLAKVSVTQTHNPKPSFKIGDCIRRAASQMTGSPSILKSSSDVFDFSVESSDDTVRKGIVIPVEYSSLDDLLSQLHLAARDPLKEFSFANIILGFFSDFRSSIVVDLHSSDKAGGKRKRSSNHLSGSPETFEFEDMSDTYWTDRVIQNGSEEQPSGTKGGYQIVPVDLGKPVQKTRRPYSRKRYSDSTMPEKPPGYVDENSPAELVMNFSEMDTLPSETNLNRMFRHFGRIKEAETEIDRETSRARVVFKKCPDAEVAFSSAGKFNIFGSMVVSYELNYSISEPFKMSPMTLTIGEDAT